jgi:hypothetical protein
MEMGWGHSSSPVGLLAFQIGSRVHLLMQVEKLTAEFQAKVLSGKDLLHLASNF